MIAHFIAKDSVLDQEALRRSASIYLPTRTVTMLPERLGCDLASLNESVARPSMSCVLTINDDGDILDWSFTRAQICITRRCTYEEVDGAIVGDGAEEVFARYCALLHRFAEATSTTTSSGFVFLSTARVEATDEEWRDDAEGAIR